MAVPASGRREKPWRVEEKSAAPARPGAPASARKRIKRCACSTRPAIACSGAGGGQADHQEGETPRGTVRYVRRVAFKIRVRVEETGLDELEHANNQVFLRWVQEAAVAHSEAVGLGL